MNAEQCYEAMGANYQAALQRMGKEALVVRLLKMFPSDPSMNDLSRALTERDPQKAFLAAHTLKGVALNMEFTALAQAASELTDILRPQAPLDSFAPNGERDSGRACERAYDAVADAYNKTIAAIRQLSE